MRHKVVLRLNEVEMIRLRALAEISGNVTISEAIRLSLSTTHQLLVAESEKQRKAAKAAEDMITPTAKEAMSVQEPVQPSEPSTV